MTQVPVRRALISVYDKRGLTELAIGLAGHGVEIVSTGSTAATISAAGVPVVQVSDVTGFPERLGGRVKTLHPAVHAGLLADRRDPEHVRQLEELRIAPFDLVIVNLYPFRETVASGAGVDEVVEQIDIGGPAMVRAAAKNHASVAVVVDPDAYPDVLAATAGGGFTAKARRRLAAEAYAHTASYDVAVASWFAEQVAQDDAGPTAADQIATDQIATDPNVAADGQQWPDFAGSALRRTAVLRYGENPHQAAALYTGSDAGGGLAGASQIHGKAMSYNNYVDADAALRAAYDFVEPCVAIIKHANPCGIAVGSDIAKAYAKAHACDPVSAYGGVIATNRPVTGAMAELVAGVFTEVIVAPAFEPHALDVLTAKKNVRLLVTSGQGRAAVEWRAVSGGVLFQTPDRLDAPGDDPVSWTLATGAPVDESTLADLAFAWRAIRSVRSNAILLADGGATVGVGMGQVNRVDSARLAVARAGDRARGSVAASDAFFPFPDGLLVLLEAGVRAVVQPGGSIRDAEVIAAASSAGVPVYLTGVRHFTH